METLRPEKALPQPPHLTTLCSISCGMAAETFFSLCHAAEVTTVVDMRVNRAYGRAFWTYERDIGYICSLHGIRYLPVEDVMPPKEMREALHAVLERKNRVESAEAWTKYLENVVTVLGERQYLNRGKATRELVYGSDKAIAFVCQCHHHRDCHRSAVLGHLRKWVHGLEVRELYPEGRAPARESLKVLTRDIPSAWLEKDDAKRIARALGGAR